MEQRLNKKLLNLNKDGLYPFHMPGHKRNSDLLEQIETFNEDAKDSFGRALSRMYGIDITEIDGFDNLHDAKEIIKDSEQRAASLFHSDETHYLVNGSTSGILAAISAVSNKGDKIIVARNSHVSAYNALMLNELNPVYVYPEVILKDNNGSGIQGSIRKEEIEKAIINNKDACAVFITSPTYDGVLSDIRSIAKIAHEYDMPLIVDEAHGALFFIEGRSAVIEGSDIVINSVHKTLPALTQTALIHINGDIVDRNRIRKYLKIYQTSSPSYVLMGSIDYAVEIMESCGNSLYREFCIRTTYLKDKLKGLRNIRYIDKDSLISEGAYDFDESKVLISTSGIAINGRALYNILREKYKMQPEMAAGEYVLLMTTLFDTKESIERLADALYEIDLSAGKGDLCYESIDDADCDLDYIQLKELKESLSQKSKKTVFAYPPGIPIIVSGETVTDEIIDEIEKALANKLDVKWIE